MFRSYGITEIAFPSRWQEDDALAIPSVGKRLRRRLRGGKSTGCDASGPLNCVNQHLRCFGIAACEFPCQLTGGTVSVVPHDRSML